MKQLLRGVIRRQQRLAYFVICFMLFALCVALLKPYGMGAILVVWIALVCFLEIGYRRLLLFEGQNRRKWWARQYNDYRSSYFPVRIYLYSFILLLYLLFHSAFTRYALAGLLASGLICAGIVRLLRKRDHA